MKRIGILGGTFNPIHNGHLILAETVKSEFQLDKVLFIPSGCSYMKNPEEILEANIRVQMVALAIKGNPGFELSEIEVSRLGNSYTCDTLLILHHQYPDSQLFNIVGADALFSMERWKNPEQIFALSVIAAAVRGDSSTEQLEEKARELALHYHADVRLLPSLQIEISSTDIRRKIRQGISVRYLVPEPVRLFLEQNPYYG